MTRPPKISEHVFLFLLLIIPVTSFTQIINYEKRSVKEFSSYEKVQGGILTDSIKNFGILRNPHNDLYTLDQTNAYIFTRVNDKFNPQLHVWYHFDIQTMEMKGIRYNWGLYNPRFNPTKERKKLEMFTKRESEFIEKYKSIRKELNDTLGNPIKTRTLADNSESFIEQAFWMDSEKIVELSIRFDRKLMEVPGIGLMSDFRIEVMTTFK